MDALIAGRALDVVGRLEDRRIEGQGTPESAWRTWAGLRAIPTVPADELASAGGRVIVVAPHPDDEVLGCGGTLAMLARRGRDVRVVGVTDGEACYPGHATLAPSQLARIRREERAVGLSRLGLPRPSSLLGHPDGQIDEDRLVEQLWALVGRHDTLLATWRRDGHPDHEVAGRAAARVAASIGCALWEFPVWMWHWAAPDDARVPWRRLRAVGLDPDAQERKSHAVAAHASQLKAPLPSHTEPILPGWALARLLRSSEVFFAPEHDA